jgi:hypothetical protein
MSFLCGHIPVSDLFESAPKAPSSVYLYIPILLGTSPIRGLEFHTSVFKSAPFSDVPGLFSGASLPALLRHRKSVELIGELGDSRRLQQGRDPLLSVAPVRQCRLHRGLACGR